MNLGRYLEGVGVQLNYANTNPTLRIPTNTGPFGVPGVTRTWTDANGNLQPDCDLLNPQANDRRTTRRRLLRPDLESALWPAGLDRQLRSGILNGWGVRAGDWSLGVSVQQQTAGANVARGRLLPALVRRLHAERQPSGSAVRLREPTASSLHRIRGCPTEAVTRSPTSTTSARRCLVRSTTSRRSPNKYGEWYQYFNGLDVTLSLRTRNGLTFRRHQHRTERRGQLRRSRQPSRAQRRHRRRSRGFHRQHHESVLSRGVRLS